MKYQLMNENKRRLKSHLFIICLLIISLVISIACSKQASNNGSEPDNSILVTQTNAAVNVDDLMREPEKYHGIILVKGVVAGIFHDEQTITLIDIREYANCGVVTCSSLMLPVSWKGIMPKPEETVQITGEIKELNKKLIFAAQTLENVNSE